MKKEQDILTDTELAAKPCFEDDDIVVVASCVISAVLWLSQFLAHAKLVSYWIK